MRFSGSLKQNHLFRRLYARGKHGANKYLALYQQRNGLGRNRIGITVGAKLGCAVRRNRVRRRLREIYRLHEEAFLPGRDIVVVARTRAMHATYRQLETAYVSLAGELGLLRKEDESK